MDNNKFNEEILKLKKRELDLREEKLKISREKFELKKKTIQLLIDELLKDND